MRVRYEGPYDVLLMHDGKVYEVHPGDEMDLPSVPKLPHFKSADTTSGKVAKGGEK